MLFFISCSNRKEEKSIDIGSKKIEVNIENTGLSSTRPFFFSNADNKLYLFDDFKNAFFEFNKEESSLLEVFSLVDENRFNVSEMHGFIYWDKILYIFSPNQIIINDILKDNVQKVNIDDLFDHISGEHIDLGFKIQFNLLFGKSIPAFDSDNLKVYFLVKNNSELKVAEYSLLVPDKINFFNIIDNKLIDEYRLSTKYNSNISVNNVVNPTLTLENNKLLISYPFMNSFEVFDLEKETLVKYNISSELHSNFKANQILKNDELSELITKIKDWNNDITFGPIYWDQKSLLYYRLIKGESIKLNPFDGDIFLSVFNQNFDLIEEKQLNKNVLDLTFEYFKMDSSLYVKRLSEDENNLKYLKINFKK